MGLSHSRIPQNDAARPARIYAASNLFRMRQFYADYRDDEKVAPLVRQLPWTHNLIILSQSKTSEEREFYLKTAIREKWSKRELERQFRGALFERAVLNPPKVSAVLRQMQPEAHKVLKDTYLLDVSSKDAKQPLCSRSRNLIHIRRCGRKD